MKICPSLSKRHCISSSLSCLALAGALASLNSCVPYHPDPYADVFLPDTINDPMEPMNRGIWVFNHQLLRGVVTPASRGYKAVVPKPARKSIRNFGYNIAYPGRVVNQVFQGRWHDAGQDSLRFVSNTTAGVLGLFDVASKWDIDKPDGDFAQTFQKWGWEPDLFVMLPVLGPSDEVHAVGFGADSLASPLAYDESLRNVGYGVSFNEISRIADDSLLKVSADPDPYSTMKYLWSYASIEGDPDWSVHGAPDASTLDTMNVLKIRLKDPKFVYQGKSGKVRIASTQKKLPFEYWIQGEKAPLVYIAPGLGSHRKTFQVLSIAENLYNRGFSVVTISGVFHPEFVTHALSNGVPGNAHEDSEDLLAALTAIDRKLQGKFADRLGKRALVGFSMGGYQTLLLAAHSGEKHRDLNFSKYVAISPPVDLQYGLDRLDAFQEAPLQWPESVRQERVNNTLHKVAAIRSRPESLAGTPPFSGIESQYLMGLVFRVTLRNTIYASQMKHDMGVLKNDLSSWNRRPVYHEILGFSFREYFQQFVLPYYKAKGVTADDIKKSNDLTRWAGGLKHKPSAAVITAENDFLLAPKDVDWLRNTFGPKRLTLLSKGGHLGYLGDTPAQAALGGYLEDLKD